MRILAIETSCDETSAAVVADGRAVESNIVSSQIEAHRLTGGVVPEVAARMQLESIIPVIEQALAKAGTDWDGIDVIAVTCGPGLIGSLLVGLETAKALALAKQKPLIPVNHLAGHLYACFQSQLSSRAERSGVEEPGSKPKQDSSASREKRSGRNDPQFSFPYTGLVVSGGHTEFVRMVDHHAFEVVGSTRDDAAGEAFDKVGKLLGLPYPGGPSISKLAEKGNPKKIKFPRAMLNQNNLDVSFSGLKTAVSQEITRGRLTQTRKADIAAGFQAAVVDTLVRKSRSALEVYPAAAFLLGGGVAASAALRNAMQTMTDGVGIELLVSPPELSTDNAAMIGLTAYWQRDWALSVPKLFSVVAEPRAHLR